MLSPLLLSDFSTSVVDCESFLRSTFFAFFLGLYLQSTEQVAAFCRSLHDMNPLDCESSSPSPDSPFPPTATLRQLSDADKLRKVICELVETERTYVKVSISRLNHVNLDFFLIDLSFCVVLSLHITVSVLSAHDLLVSGHERKVLQIFFPYFFSLWFHLDSRDKHGFEIIHDGRQI